MACMTPVVLVQIAHKPSRIFVQLAIHLTILAIMVFEPKETVVLLILVVPNFNVSATMAFIDPFRAANYLDGRPHFRWHLVSEDGGTCLGSNGISVETKPLSAFGGSNPDLIILSSSWAPEEHASPRVNAALREFSRAGATIGGLDTGAFILAQAGLLNGRKATVHYEHIDAFQELYPKVDVTESLFEFDGNRITCCGGSASVEFGLHILQGIHGATLANAAARYIFHPSLREHASRQQPEGEPLGSQIPATVKQAIQLMEDHLEEILPIPKICEKIGISHRQLDRLFSAYIQKTPALYYRDIRLDRARGLVTQTQMPMSEIAVASGFASQVHFSRAYRQRFGLPPLKDRVEGRVPFEFRAWPMHRRGKN